MILPTGSVTFLVADVDQPTRRGFESAPGARRPHLGQHVDAVLGVLGGQRPAAWSDDKVVAVFDSPATAVAAALDLRAAIAERAELEALRHELRIGLHSGEARVRDDGRYLGTAVRTSERLAEIANGGQTLLSAPTAAAAAGLLPPGSSLVDLGLHRLRDLSPPMRVFGLDRGERVTTPVSLRSLDTVPNNLPVHLSGFVGRQAELAAIGALLRAERLVTLTGVGGAGKTRLAAQAAADQAERWPDGVRWVELDTVTDPAEIADQVAMASGVLVEPIRGPLRSTTLQLQDRRVLICLDNCEQVLEGVAEVAEALLRSCPEVTVLATSREPLGVPGEAVWQVPPLAEEDALALFVERGSLVRPWFTLDASTEAAIRTMCARLDGIPLALELAAAWLRALTPQQIEAGLDDRFALLVRGPRGAVPRQQTLAASIDWSHALLDESDRIVFRRLAVFAGSFDLDAAQAVCSSQYAVGSGGPTNADGQTAMGDVRGLPAAYRLPPTAEVLHAIGRLVDKSLVVAEERAGEVRYRLLETIRQYAAGRLDEAGEAAMARDRHLDHFLALAEALEPERRRDMDAWRTRLEHEHDNLCAALDWGLSAPATDRGRRLAATLPWLWHLHGHGHEGIAYLRRAVLLAPDDRSILQAQLLTGIALVADTVSPLDLEFDAAQRALEIATERGDERLRAVCLALSAVGQFYTDFDAAWQLAADALGTAERAGDALMADGARALQGIILHLRDCHEPAEPLLQSAVDGLLGRHRGIAATTLGYQASGALYTGHIDRARQLAVQAVQVAEPLGDYHRTGSTRSVLALVHALAGDVDAGLEALRPVLRLVEGAEDDVFVPGMARAMGTLSLQRGEAEQAVTWFEREARSTDRGTETWLAAQALPGLGAALGTLGRLDEARGVLERAIAVARRLNMPRVVADALEQQAHLAVGDDEVRATDLHHEALAVRAQHGLRTFYADSLDSLAALPSAPLRGGRASGARAEPAAEAVRVLAASDEARRAMRYPRDPARQLAHDAALAGLRAALGDQQFAEAWAEGTRLPLDEAVTYIRRSRGARRRPSLGWGSLTPTELDVVQLVVQGLNNPQICRRLFMSRGTVKTHLTHVYAKLGVANRTELATLATSRLVPAYPTGRASRTGDGRSSGGVR